MPVLLKNYATLQLGVIDCAQVSFTHNHEFVFVWMIFINSFGAKSLILDFQQVFYSGIIKHCCS